MSVKPKKYVDSGALISACGQYRYALWREWRAPLAGPMSVLFVMLNPSTADGETDDATIRKCVSFANRWGYGRLEVVNLFAYRATEPGMLFKAQAAGADIIGWQNQERIQESVSDAGMIVCAWGAHAAGHEFHVEEVRGWLLHHGHESMALGFTKDGHPRHPLYVPLDTPLRPMPP